MSKHRIFAGTDGPTPQLHHPLAVGVNFFSKECPQGECEVVALLLARELRRVHGLHFPGAVHRYEAALRTEANSAGRRTRHE